MPAPSRPANTLAALKQAHAVRLRAGGQSFQQVADAYLPCQAHRPTGAVRDCPDCVGPMYAHRASAKRAVDKALEQEYAAGQDTREQLRRHQLAQIDLLLQAAMPKALGADWEAARVATRLLDRRARLLGLDAPARVTITSELDAAIEDLTAQLAGVDQ